MDTEIRAAKRRKMNYEEPLIPKLCYDVAMECLVRVSLDYQTLCSMKRVCRRWRELLSHDNSQFFKRRRLLNLEEPSYFFIEEPSYFFISCTDFHTLEVFTEDFVCVAHNSSIYILGGKLDSGDSVSDFWIVDIEAHHIKRP